MRKSMMGKNNPKFKHGECYTKPYRVFGGILKRCNDKNHYGYKWYGGRGIKCLWETYEDFWKDMKNTYEEGLTIERIDKNGHYCKENCKWANREEQANNRRGNHKITYKGETLGISQWARKTGIPRTTIMNRIKRGRETELLFIKNSNNGKKKPYIDTNGLC